MRVAPSSWGVVFAAAIAACVDASHTAAQVTSRPSPDHVAALRAWLESPHDDSRLLDEAVRQTLDAGKAALRHVGGACRDAFAGADENRKAALELVLRDVALGYLERERESGMFFAGQYDPLAELQPWIGRIYLQLVIDTPDWFPDSMRTSVIPALRDLFPDGPGIDRRGALRTIALDEIHEPLELRFALACAFAQWGDRTIVQPFLDELADYAGDSSDSDELHFTARLARTYHLLRDYGDATERWLAFLRGREALGVPPQPIDYYNTACCASLAGRIRDALREIETCGALLRSPDLDESHRIERKLFDQDPELRAIRPTRRFQDVVNKTFGDSR